MTQAVLTDAEFAAFVKLIYEEAGIALTEAKRQLVQSRLQRRLRTLRLGSYGEYCRLAKADPNERREFVNCITTNKTGFFREPHHFDYLVERHFPELVRQAQAGQRNHILKIWHAGCSTGEEPYTMAMVLADHLLGDGAWDVRMLASDIDTNVLDEAQEAIYDSSRVAAIPYQTLQRHFLRGGTPENRLYKVRPQLRDLITFRHLNLNDAVWPINPKTRFDIIFCRNVIIYFNRQTQKQLIDRFTQLLQPHGLLILGHSESLLGCSGRLETLGQTIFRRTGASSSGVAA